MLVIFKKQFQKQYINIMGTSILHIKTEIDCRIYLFDEEKGIAKAGTYFNLEVRKGEQDLLFISVEDERIHYHLIYNVEENDCDYRIAIEKSQFKHYTHEILDEIQKAEQGDATAQCQLGQRYWLSIEVERNEKEAMKWLLKSANQGNAEAQRLLGLCYFVGAEETERDYEKAAKWFQESAKNGDRFAQYRLGLCYENGWGVEQNYEDAVRWYCKAAEQGHAEAQCDLGWFYLEGKGIEQNYEKAAKLFSEAAVSGFRSAEYSLGVCYENGYGVEQNWREAVKWYRLSAERGHAAAQFNLGCCYFYGAGIEADLKEAVKWYYKAAEQGFAEAICSLGYCYQAGFGVEQSYEKAIELYQKSAELGCADAQYNLGCCYKDGLGVDQDWEEAVKWYRYAANQGMEDAKSQSDELEEKIRNHNSEVVRKQPYYLFFDTETTGIPKSYNSPASNTRNWPRLVQLAWIMTDVDGNRLSSGNDIIKPDGFLIPSDAVKVHGITTAKALQEGKPLRNVLESFMSEAKQAKCFVGHNISFDQKIVGAELCRLGIMDTISTKEGLCTMKAGTDYCKIPGYFGYKHPKLQELYKKLFGVEFKDAHNAMSDIEATEKCFWALRKKKLI